MELFSVVINGKVHRLSQKAIQLLGLEVQAKEKPTILQKLPPDLKILKIQKKEPEPVVEKVAEKVAEPVLEVKKKEDVIVASTEETKPKRKRSGKVGVKK